MCICGGEWVCPCMSVDALRVQKRVSDTPELGLWVVRSCLMWVLGTELQSSRRGDCNLNH